MGRPKNVEFDPKYEWKTITQKIKKTDSERYVLLERLLGVSRRTIKKWFAKGMMPQAKLDLLHAYIKGDIRIPKKNSLVEEPIKAPDVSSPEVSALEALGCAMFPKISIEAFETPTFRDACKWLFLCEEKLKPMVIRGDSYSTTAYIRACAGIDVQKEIDKLRKTYGPQITFDTILDDIFKEDSEWH